MNSGLLSTGLPRSVPKAINQKEEIDITNLANINITLDSIQTCITPITDINVGDPFNLSTPPPVIEGQLYNQDAETCTGLFNLQYNLEDLITNASTCSIRSGKLLTINYV